MPIAHYVLARSQVPIKFILLCFVWKPDTKSSRAEPLGLGSIHIWTKHPKPQSKFTVAQFA